jgi:predicted nucleotidyltransferase
MPTRTLTVRGVPDVVLRALRASAEANRRSLNGELLTILEEAAAERRTPTGQRVRGPIAEPYAVAREPAAPAPSLLDAVDRVALAAVCRRHHIRWLALFGSRVTGGAGPESDVDVVVDFVPGMTPGLGIVAVAEALRPVLGGARVDLVTRRGLAAPLRDRILAEAVPLYGA